MKKQRKLDGVELGVRNNLTVCVEKGYITQDELDKVCDVTLRMKRLHRALYDKITEPITTFQTNPTKKQRTKSEIYGMERDILSVCVDKGYVTQAEIDELYEVKMTLSRLLDAVRNKIAQSS